MVVEREDLEIGRSGELLADPVVAVTPDLSFVDVRLARVHADHANPPHVPGPVALPDQLLEMEVADVASVVVPGDRPDRRFDSRSVREPFLELLPVALVDVVARAHHGVA